MSIIIYNLKFVFLSLFLFIIITGRTAPSMCLPSSDLSIDWAPERSCLNQLISLIQLAEQPWQHPPQFGGFLIALSSTCWAQISNICGANSLPFSAEISLKRPSDPTIVLAGCLHFQSPQLWPARQGPSQQCGVSDHLHRPWSRSCGMPVGRVGHPLPLHKARGDSH